jgi:cytochrome c2
MERSKLATFGTALASIFVVGGIIAAFGVFRSLPPLNPNAAPTAVVVGTPPFDVAAIEAGVARGDPAAGEALFTKYGCVGCHGIQNGAGPYVVGLGSRAASRRPGYSAIAYLYESITNPNAFIVPSYPANVMPQNFKSLIAPDDLNNLIAWLLKQ